MGLELGRKLIGRRGDALEAVADLRQVGFAVFGQHQTPVHALEQGNAQCLLQVLDLLADGAWGDREFLRGPAETQVGVPRPRRRAVR